MSAKWAEKLTRWWACTHAGVGYSVNHLHPFRFPMGLPETKLHSARTVEVRVGFSCHTFTRNATKGDAGLVAYYEQSHERRMFCPLRYALSLSLPDTIRGLPSRSCYFARRNNYFVLEAHALLPEGQEYRVFFDVRNVGERDAVLVYIQSAYAADKGRPGAIGFRRKKVGFRVLVNHALQGSKPTEPP